MGKPDFGELYSWNGGKWDHPFIDLNLNYPSNRREKGKEKRAKTSTN